MKAAIEFVLRAYRRLVSPLLPPACRYVPSCSEYAQEAVAVHGAGRGVLLAAWRLLRCHPLARGGYDPVPRQAAPKIPTLRCAQDGAPDEYQG
jgi:putative membrane protein insertion efficiency factor